MIWSWTVYSDTHLELTSELKNFPFHSQMIGNWKIYSDTSLELTSEIFEIITLYGGTHQYQIVGNWTVNSDTSAELTLEIFERKARHGEIRYPRGKFLGGHVCICLQIKLSAPLLCPYIPFSPNILLPLRVDFLNRLTILNLRLCKRFKSIDELPISLKAMDANNTISLEWIIAGSNWKLSKQQECFGSSKLLQKNPTGNPRKKLIKVSLSLSLSLSLSRSLIELGFLDHNSILMT